MSTETDKSGGRTDCPPQDGVIIVPPGEVSFIAAGLGLALALGFVMGAIFAARIRNSHER